MSDVIDSIDASENYTINVRPSTESYSSRSLIVTTIVVVVIVAVIVTAVILTSTASSKSITLLLPNSINWGNEFQTSITPNRTGAMCAQYNNSMYMYGGSLIAGPRVYDVWAGTLSNGQVSFKQLTSNTSIVPQMTFGQFVVLSNGTFLLLGGLDENFRPSNIVYSSTNAIDWTSVARSVPWAARYLHASGVASNDLIVLVGGALISGTNQTSNQSWLSKDGGNSWYNGGIVPFAWLTFQNPALGYTHIGGSEGTIILVGGIYAGGTGNTIFTSTDSGMSWQYIGLVGDFGQKFTHQLFTDVSGVVYMTDQIYSDTVWYTADAGNTWLDIPAVQPVAIIQGCAAFLNDNQLSSIVLYSGRAGKPLQDFGAVVGVIVY